MGTTKIYTEHPKIPLHYVRVSTDDQSLNALTLKFLTIFQSPNTN